MNGFVKIIYRLNGCWQITIKYIASAPVVG